LRKRVVAAFSTPVRISFGPFTLDREQRQLLRGDAPVALTPKALLLLDTLLLERPRALSKEELFGRLWPGAYIGDASLSVTMAALRRALGDDARHPRFVRTVHGYGYGWCGEASLDGGAPAPSPLACSLMWHRREIPLQAGENLLGRDPLARVVVDDPGVSRRHGRVLVDGDSATLEDLGSKNGTRRNGERLQEPAALADGDEIGIGPATLVFRLGRSLESTLTRRA
jgi:DNA-binding winged helix-turn-helix (wHTH) protein